MNKTITLLLLFVVGISSCKTAEKEFDKLEIAKQYYKALDNSDSAAMKILLTDSLITKETDYDYRQTFSKKEYTEGWLKWDSVFNPTYKILEIKQENDIVKAKISKMDKRINLLHEKPTVWSSIIRFDSDKILSIERTNVTFNDKTWEGNRTKLLNWIDENHPELNGFLNGQTQSVGMQYLKAIELYTKKK